MLKTLRFLDACKSGMLVQRKTGRDICSIIPESHGSVILDRMIPWCPECWLVIVDVRMDRNKDGKLVLNGREIPYYYNQLDGALDAWERRGGFTKWVPRDKDLMVWLARQLEYLQSRTEEKVLLLKKPIQRIVGPNDALSRGISLLSCIEGIGVEKARVLLEYYGSVAAALEAVLDPKFYKNKNRPSGFGEVTTVNGRRLFGLTEDWMRMVVVGEESREQ